MRKGKMNRSSYKNEEFFVLRAPLYPAETLIDLSKECQTAALWRKGEPKEKLTKKYEDDCESVRTQMFEMVEDPLFNEALLVSSASLVKNLDRWFKKPLERKGAGVERSVLKYLTRATTRCTPYGQMAGVALGKIETNGKTALVLGKNEKNTRHTRVDSGMLLEMAASVANDSDCRTRLTYYPNNTQYKLGDRIRYFEADGHPYAENGRLVSVAAGDVAGAILERAKQGAKWSELTAEVKRLEPEATYQEVEDFLLDMTASQLLVPDVFPSPTGKEMLHDFKDRLAEQAPDHKVLKIIDELVELSENLNSNPLGKGKDLLNRISTLGRDFRKEEEGLDHDDSENSPDSRNGNNFQVDMTLDCKEASINSSHVESVQTVLDCLYRINGQTPSNILESFIEEFIRKYDDGEVPLSQVLDPDGGIRFGVASQNQNEPSPLLKVPVFNLSRKQRNESNVGNEATVWQSELLINAAQKGDTAINLKASDVTSRFPKPDVPVMPSITALVSACNLDEKRKDEAPSWVLLRANGAQNLSYMGRFAHILGDELTIHLQRSADLEQAADNSILAEVSYLPPSRLGNVCQQPSFRQARIEYKSPSCHSENEIVYLDDLLVSVRGRRVLLRSRKTGQLITPRVDHMLNVSHKTSPAIFNFLGMLQNAGKHGFFEWTWGSLARLDDLPRVTIGSVVVSPRTWKIKPSEFLNLKIENTRESCQVSGFSNFITVQEWRDERAVPRWVAVGSMTDYMVFDLENPLSVDLFLREIRKNPIVRETFLKERSSAVTGDAGQGFVNEVVLPFWSRDVLEIARQEGFFDGKNKALLKGKPAPFPPENMHTAGLSAKGVGAGVLNVKLYGGASVLDKVLRNEMPRLLSQLEKNGLIDNWFFIRYADPDFHLRVRLFGSPEKLGGIVMPILEKYFSSETNPGIWRLRFESYEPEYERYGGVEGIRLAEQLFAIDSKTLLPMMLVLDRKDLKNKDFVSGIEGRWLLGALSVDSLLIDLGLSLEERLEFTQDYGNALAAEFGFGKHQNKETGKLFRKYRHLLVETLSNEKPGGSSWQGAVRTILCDRTRRISIWARSLDAGIKEGTITQPKAALVQSFVHMHCNRIFISQMRRQEAVLLQLLQKHYLALLNHGKQKTAAAQERTMS